MRASNGYLVNTFLHTFLDIVPMKFQKVSYNAIKKFVKKCINNSVIDEFVRNFLNTVTRHEYYIGKI